MKHFLLKTILPAFLLLGAASLTACNKLPSSNYEKVKFAFTGVEKTFKDPKTAKKSLSLAKRERLGGSNTDAGLSTIFNLYTQEDKRNDFLEDVEYNQPPMIQFQYMKKVLEKVGDGYEFGTKYFDTITGDVYLDIATGLKSNNENDKFAYTFGLAMDINIDSDDLITADVSFDIKIARGQEEYNTKWYVAIELDYDMQNTTPNYEMTMVTENNESELPYYQHYTYEYDYVKVKDSAISEWRKFCMDNNNRLVKDAAHPNFESYTRGDAKYKVDACSWFKDGVYYKNKRTRELNGNEAKIVGEALYNDLGLNANEINADVFFDKTSTQNGVLKTCYQEFCEIAKEDIIYSLLTREEQGGDQQKQRSAIRAMNGDLTGGAENYLIPKETTVGQIFNGFIDGYGKKTIVVLYYVDQSGGLMEEIRELNSLTFFFKLRNKSFSVMFDSTGETLETAYNRLIENYEISENDVQRECEIVFTSNENPEIKGAMPITYSGDLPSVYTKPKWPEALKSLGVPEYDGEKVEYTYYGDDSYLEGNKKYLNIKNSTYEEGEAYCTKLLKNGFEWCNEFGLLQNEVAFKKAISDQYNLYVVFYFGKNMDSFTLTVWREEVQVNPPVPEQPFHVYVIGDFNNWGKNTPDEFEASYVDEQWLFTLEDFHVNAGETFAFVTNVQDPGQQYFGLDQMVDSNFDDFLMHNFDKGPFAMKALCDFTVTFVIYGDQTLHADFATATVGISYLTIVGSFNSWSETDGVIEMAKNGDRFEARVSLDAQAEFKVMQNHSWTINYGYNEIMAGQDANLKEYFTFNGEFGNMVTLKAVTFMITAVNDGTGHATFKINILG